MEKAMVTTEARPERGRKRDPSETLTVCKKSLVMPSNTITLDVEDVLFYKKNEMSYGGRKSPYIIYLSTEFKKAMHRRSKTRILKWIIVAVMVLVGILLILFFIRMIFSKP